MQNSDKLKFLKDKLILVENLTDKISDYLDKDFITEANYTKNLDSLYSSRKKELYELKKLMTTFNTLIDDSLSIRVEVLIEKDKNNLDKLNKKIEFIRLNLRKLNNKKSLLLYR